MKRFGDVSLEKAGHAFFEHQHARVAFSHAHILVQKFAQKKLSFRRKI
jgi:hypothetical protein